MAGGWGRVGWGAACVELPGEEPTTLQKEGVSPPLFQPYHPFSCHLGRSRQTMGLHLHVAFSHHLHSTGTQLTNSNVRKVPRPLRILRHPRPRECHLPWGPSISLPCADGIRTTNLRFDVPRTLTAHPTKTIFSVMLVYPTLCRQSPPLFSMTSPHASHLLTWTCDTTGVWEPTLPFHSFPPLLAD
jgi:hypothetical protein